MRTAQIIFYATFAALHTGLSAMHFKLGNPGLGLFFLVLAMTNSYYFSVAVESEPENETIDTGEDK